MRHKEKTIQFQSQPVDIIDIKSLSGSEEVLEAVAQLQMQICSCHEMILKVDRKLNMFIQIQKKSIGV